MTSPEYLDIVIEITSSSGRSRLVGKGTVISQSRATDLELHPHTTGFPVPQRHFTTIEWRPVDGVAYTVSATPDGAPTVDAEVVDVTYDRPSRPALPHGYTDVGRLIGNPWDQ